MKINQALEIIQPRINELILIGVINYSKIVSSVKSKDILKTYKGLNFVYFIIEKKIVTYVGSTKNISSRLSQHRVGKFFDNVLIINFVTIQDMIIIEREFIRNINPNKNTQHKIKL